jgi:thiosulfate dehydrogenase [quinone] large subunit
MEKASGKQSKGRVQYVEDPPFARALFGSTAWAWLWLVVRLYVGWDWIKAGWGKLHSPAWIGNQSGTALSGFIQGALAKAQGTNPQVQDWYATFLKDVVLPNASTWGIVVSWGEFLVGLGLILGVFTGIAAFFGIFMNMNYLLAGSISINPFLLLLGLGLLLAWKVAGWWGIDRWLLPALGTPWSPGYVFHQQSRALPAPHNAPAKS